MPITELKRDDTKQRVTAVLVFGDTGSGKTTALSTLLKYGSLTVFDLDMQGGKLYQSSASEACLTIWQLNPAEQGNYVALRKLLREYQNGTRQSDIIALDTSTSLHDLCLTEGRKHTGATEPGAIDRDTYRLAADYFDLAMQQFMAIRAIRIVNSHVTAVKDKDGNILRVEPALPGQMVTKLPRKFGAVFFAEAIQKEGRVSYRFNTTPSRMRIVRAPWAGWPGVIEQDYKCLFE